MPYHVVYYPHYNFDNIGTSHFDVATPVVTILQVVSGQTFWWIKYRQTNPLIESGQTFRWSLGHTNTSF